ncbi:isopeptide-forming domain-containing fimbrial protein [Leucobacter komagatae]|uniref:isopeptide-forming domain-containing fimbrial protein n=1 Tax=Leucobacter komagatae TaxID=55969 RepID=UPI00147773AA|nr:isopeptide-forming domain-containing fimbrial protein [Leucobacter komagatae]
MSALVGIVMPLADTGIASAQAVERTLATPETNAAEQPSDAQEETAPAAPDETTEQTEGGATTPTPDEDTNVAEPEAAQPAQPAQPRAQAAPLAAPTGPTLKWSITDANGAPVKGATATLQGPATRGGFYDAAWPTSYEVADCVGTCGPNSMDQDPRAGYFAVDRTVVGNRTTMLTSTIYNQRFRVQPSQHPAGTSWDSSKWIEIPGSSTFNWPHVPAQNPWGSDSYDFGSLKLGKSALECVAGTFYSISQEGQLKRVDANVDNETAVVKDIGSPALTVNGQSFNGLAVGLKGEAVFAYERKTMPASVYQYDTAKQNWVDRKIQISLSNLTVLKNLQLIGGALDNEGTYWVGGFVKEGNSTKGNFQLWALPKNGTKMELRGQLNIRALERSYIDNGNGDFAFDNEGNLFLIRGVSNGRGLAVFSAKAADLANGRGTELVKASTVFAQNTVSPFSGVNGIAYDAAGRLFVGGSAGLGYLDLPLTGEAPGEFRFPQGNDSWSTTDLASCSFPPTVKVQKELPDGRAFASDQFTLELKTGNSLLGSATTTGSSDGLQADAIEPVPVAIGSTLTIQEKPGSSSTKLANYSSSWECALGSKVLWSAKSTTGSFTMPADAAGKEITCTFRNSLMQVSKTANVASGTPVDAGTIVQYTLTFDNSQGASAVAVSYRDFMADVLDDAYFVRADGTETKTPIFTIKGGVTVDWDATNRWLTLGGSIAAGGKGTVTVAVKVRENSDNADQRQTEMAPEGFFLRNKLARGTSDAPPKTCSPGLCVEHPIDSWTVAKDSLPADTARLHKGGNVHYKVTATKTNAETALNGLVLQDDLTHVFKSAGWAPEAAVPGGAQAKGVYLFNSEGRTIDLNGQPNTGSKEVLRAVRDVAAPTQVNVAPSGAPADMRWIVTSGAPLDLPKEAVRAEMWFAVQAAESPVGIPAASTWEGQGNTPTTGWKFVNYATGMAKSGSGATAKDFAPNACVTGKNVPNTAFAPNSAQPVDVNFPEQCRVQHELSQNYFTIRKDAGGAGVQALADDKAWDPDPTGLWNMIGHEFEVRDNDKATGKATSYPSVQLCRTDYDPEQGWRGEWISPANAGDKSRWDFSTENSATAKKILDWNNAHPDEADQLPVCGTLYEISDGGQKGRWRSENLNAGDYWLVETKAPNAQTDVTAEKTRPVPGVQKLAQPVPFKIWPEEDGTSLGGPAMQGRGQLDVGNGSGKYLDRCNPGQQKPGGEFEPGGTIAERPTACVNPTGYLMLVKDPAPVPLPLTGGQWLPMVLGGGAAVLIVALAGALWWRRRGTNPSAPIGRHGA